ncbi:MAG: histidine kinase dimerization/phospho-acceptor domain-containing protein [Alphaproteobacteria bacterium]
MNRPIDRAAAGTSPAEALRTAARRTVRGRSLWDADRSAIAWADPDGIEAWGADSLGALLDARFDPAHPLPRMLTALRDRLDEGESVIEGLRLVSRDGLTLEGLCRITGQRLADARLGLMIDRLDARLESTRLDHPPKDPADRTAMAATEAPPVAHSAATGLTIAGWPPVAWARPLQGLLDAFAEAVALLDGTGTVAAVNASARRLLGPDGPDPVGRSFADWLDGRAARALADVLAKAPRPGETHALADGEDIPLLDETGMVRRPVAVLLGTLPTDRAGARHLALIRDLSGQRTREQALESARDEADLRSRRKSEVLARVSHGLRTPLTAILGFSEMLMKGVGEPDPNAPAPTDQTRLYARHVFEAGQHALSLVDDLLELSRIEAGRLALHSETFDLPPVVEACVTMVRPLAAHKRVTLDARLHRSLDPVDMDPRSLRQILVGLLSLAIRRSPAEGTVTLSVQRSEDGQIGIAVQDQGAPFGSETLGSLRRQALGDGSFFAGDAPLDLPLAKALTEANHGSFCVESDGQYGTLIQIMVPAAGEPHSFL